MVGPGSAFTDPQATPATSTEPTPSESAQPPAPTGAPQTADAPARETTQDAPAGQQERPRATLTAEERRAILAEADPEELFQANDRLGGHLGKLAQRQARQIKRAEALQSNDPDAALAVLREEASEQQVSQTHSHWEDAVRFHLEHAPEEVRQRLKGKEYGHDPLLAGINYWRDLAQGSVAELKSVQAKFDRDLKAAVEKAKADTRAEIYGDEPSPDVGAGAAAGNGAFRWRSLGEATAALRAMPASQYAQHEAQIDAEMARLRTARQRGAA